MADIALIKDTFHTKRFVLTVLVLCIGFTVYYGTYAGQFCDFDLTNYHYYSAHSLLSGTYAYHMAPSQIQSWINPLGQLPAYTIITYTNPFFGTIVFSTIDGAVLFFLFCTCFFFFDPRLGIRTRLLFSMLCAFFGALSPLFVSEIGTTFPDLDFSFLLHLAILLFILYMRKKRVVLIIASSALIGAMAGLKLAFATFVVGYSVSLVLLALRKYLTVRHLAVAGISVFIGLIITYGFWGYTLYAHYGNPFFPFYNEYFKSDWYYPVNFFDKVFLPKTFDEGLSFPFKWALGLRTSAWRNYHDIRFAINFVLLIISVPIFCYSLFFRDKSPNIERVSLVPSPIKLFFIPFFFVSYITWLLQFSISRYFIPMDLLSGLLFLILIDYLIKDRRKIAVIFSFIALCSFCWNFILNDTPKWAHFNDFKKSWFGVKPPAHLIDQSIMFVIIDSGNPNGYLVPFFHPKSRFVRVTGNMDLKPGVHFSKYIQEAIDKHPGSIRSMTFERPTLESSEHDLLQDYNLQMKDSECDQIETIFGQYYSCVLVKNINK